MPHGVVPRADARCPYCGALERHRLMRLYLEQCTPLARSEPLSLLHFAPEPGLFRWFRTLPALHYVSVDLDSFRAMVHADICALPFPADRFDAILCSHVLEHIPDDRRALAELYRVLRPGGWAILQVPMQAGRAATLEDPSVVTPADRERLFGQRDHVRLYGADYFDRVRAAGFDVRLDDFYGTLSPAVIQRYALWMNELICVGSKAKHGAGPAADAGRPLVFFGANL